MSASQRYLVLAAAFLAIVFDGVELGLMPVASLSVSKSLLGPAFTPELGGEWFARFTAALMLGAAIGGIALGNLGDRIGRTRAMGVCVLVYSGFAAMGSYAQDQWQMLALRFLVGLGVGGVWPNGIALVSECWSGASKPVVSGVMMAGLNVGILLLSQVARHWSITPDSWRWVFQFAGVPALLGVLVLAALGSIAEVMLLRGLLDLGGHLQSPEQRVVAVVAMVGLLVALALLEWPRGMLVESLGRRLELRVRVALQTKVPRLPDRYFRSRLISDMAQRSHSLALVPQLPRMLVGLVGSCFGLAAVVGGLVWMDPSSAAIAIGAALLSVVVPLVFLPLLSERDFRVRTHLGALASAYLDGLLGITAVRAHAAERATRREHETLLVEWQRAARALLTASVGIEAVMALFGFGLAAGLVGSYLMDGGGLAGTLLVAYWALSIPTQGERVAAAARSYPQVRSVFMRILEVLGAP
ncbi:MAG: MFS transporter, partial [Planctomycetaceae bacterium]|nr:MFS transporter [Planctomycetaceae bacterium]